LKIEAWSFPLLQPLALTLAQFKNPVNYSFGAAHGIGRGKGAEIKCAVLLYFSDNSKAWKRLSDIKPETGVLFVITQDDVVTRHKSFNEIALKDKCLLLGRGQDEFKAIGLCHHPAGLGGRFRFGSEIG